MSDVLYVSGAGLRSYRIKSRTDFLEGVRNITHGAKLRMEVQIWKYKLIFDTLFHIQL